MSGRVAVIGAGSTGITAVKCLVEAGFTDVVCFERRDVLGGLWYFTERKARWADESCVARSTVINTSKEFMCFSDYPMPDSCPNFCHNTDVEAYFQDYARHFGVDKHIRYNTEVVFLTKHSTYQSTGKWELKLKEHQSGQETREVFDFVLVCNGHHGEPHMPTFPGQDKFKGKIIHSKEYKDVSGYLGKRAVVVGIGNSGGDITSELSKYCKTFLATRRGAWIMHRLVDHGLPWDLFFHQRFKLYVERWKSVRQITQQFREICNSRFDHDLFAMTPDHPPGSTHPTANDELPNRIACGMVKVKPNIQSFTETGVTFEDGTHEDNIDLVVLCTGYNVGFKFIDKDVIDVKENLVNMYKYMWIPELPKQSLALLGVFQPLGAIFPITEMQSRLAARVFKGEVKLPSEAEMRADVENHNKANAARYVHSQRHTIQVDWLPFMDELATMVGCKPNLWKLLFTDPILYKAVLFGPGAPYQFRIHGPNAWPGARHALLTVMDRIRAPYQTRKIPCHQEQKGVMGQHVWRLVAVGLAVLAFVVYRTREGDKDLSTYFDRITNAVRNRWTQV